MRYQSKSATLAIVAILAFGGFQLAKAQSRARSHQGWQYLISDRQDLARSGDLLSGMDKMGRDGWELVTVIPNVDDQRRGPEFVFKRQLSQGL